MKKDKEQEVVTIEEGNKPPMIDIDEGPTQPEKRVQYNDKLEELEDADETDEIKPEVTSGFFLRESKKYMAEAIREAKKALAQGEVPVGAVLVKDKKIIARGYNKKEKQKDLTKHAEMSVIRKAEKVLSDWRLSECELYVTLEPCPMCMGAILQSGIKKLVYGATEPVMGAVESKVSLPELYKSKLEIIGGVSEDKCSQILKDFFEEKRVSGS